MMKGKYNLRGSKYLPAQLMRLTEIKFLTKIINNLGKCNQTRLTKKSSKLLNSLLQVKFLDLCSQIQY